MLTYIIIYKQKVEVFPTYYPPPLIQTCENFLNILLPSTNMEKYLHRCREALFSCTFYPRLYCLFRKLTKLICLIILRLYCFRQQTRSMQSNVGNSWQDKLHCGLGKFPDQSLEPPVVRRERLLPRHPESTKFVGAPPANFTPPCSCLLIFWYARRQESWSACARRQNCPNTQSQSIISV